MLHETLEGAAPASEAFPAQRASLFFAVSGPLEDRHLAPGHHVKSLEGGGLKRASHQSKSPSHSASFEGRRSPSALRRLVGGHREVTLDCPFRERCIVQRETPAVHAKEDDEGEEQSRC